MNLNDITVIIPTKNEARNIVTFLSNLPSDIPLIVVDSSDDETREVMQQQRPENTQIIFKKCTIPEARQTGVEAASSTWVLFSDADMCFDESYFSNLSGIKIPENTGAVMGGKHSNKDYKIYYRLYSYAIGIGAFFKFPLGSGSNMILRKKAVEQIGGFDFALTHSEDSDILIRIQKAGWRVVYNSSLKVYEMDHRRLDNGIFKKFSHGLLRSLLLFTGIKKDKVRQSDWGYWDNKNNKSQK